MKEPEYVKNHKIFTLHELTGFAQCTCGWSYEHPRMKIVRRAMQKHHNKTGHDLPESFA
jgi:hypothetical protein